MAVTDKAKFKAYMQDEAAKLEETYDEMGALIYQRAE